jgi:hypothetical protein
MGQQSPVSDLLFHGQLNRHFMDVDLCDQLHHEGHDHRGLNRMGSESDDKQQALAETTDVIKKNSRAGGYRT